MELPKGSSFFSANTRGGMPYKFLKSSIEIFLTLDSTFDIIQLQNKTVTRGR